MSLIFINNKKANKPIPSKSKPFKSVLNVFRDNKDVKTYPVHVIIRLREEIGKLR